VDWKDRIEINPEVLVGKPVVKGTRLAVEFVLELIATGNSEQEILANYPRLTREDVLACVAYAVEIVRSERVFRLSA
jgi:uncharacterized protein (DUF433 family)